MPRPTRFPDYVFQPFPEMLILPSGEQIIVDSEEEKARALDAATAPGAAPAQSNVTEIRRGPGRPRKIA